MIDKLSGTRRNILENHHGQWVVVMFIVGAALVAVVVHALAAPVVLAFAAPTSVAPPLPLAVFPVPLTFPLGRAIPLGVAPLTARIALAWESTFGFATSSTTYKYDG